MGENEVKVVKREPVPPKEQPSKKEQAIPSLERVEARAAEMCLDLEEMSNRNLVYLYQDSFLYMLKSGKRPELSNSLIVRMRRFDLLQIKDNGRGEKSCFVDY